MDDLDITEVVAEWGNRYVDEGQSMADIHGELFETGGLADEFTMIPEDSDLYKSVYASADDVLQAFSIPFTPKGKVTFKPTQQRLGEFKIDTVRRPDDFRKSWLGFLSQHAKDPDRSTWGIVEWILRDRLIPKAQNQFKLDVAYWGWQYDGFAAVPTVDEDTFERELTDADAPTPANASMDGVHTQIARWAAAGRTVQINVGAWNTADTTDVTFCTQVENFVLDSTIDNIRDNMDILFMNKSMARRYTNGRRAKYNLNWGQVSDLNLIEGTEIRVKGYNDMTGSTNVWMTPKNNRVKPTRGTGKKLFDVQKVDRTVKFLGDWSYVLTFDVPEFIVHSEHDVAISEAMVTALYTEA